MRSWLRIVIAIAVAFVSWFAVATIGNFAIRALLPGYADVEKATDFTFPMLAARLVLGAVASLGAGIACAAVAGRGRAAIYCAALLLFAMFVAVHINRWKNFPLWFHWIFLGSLVPLLLVGAGLYRSREGDRA